MSASSGASGPGAAPGASAVSGASGASGADARGLTPEIRAVAVVVIVGAIMSILDTTIVNVALESLARDLDAPLSTIQWVATGYLLSLATVIPLTGWAAETFGPRRVWMTVVAAFVVTSALCALAWNAESLIAFRVLQGFAGGMIMPIGMITLAQAAGPARVGQVMGVVGVPMLMGPVLGPVIGGLIVTHLDWRWIFLVNLPVGIVGLLLAAKRMPSARAEGRASASGLPSRLDWRGLLLLSPGVALVVFGLSEVSTHGGVTFARVLPALAGFVLVVAFSVHAWRSDSPLVDVHLFRGRGFSAAAVTVFLVGGALFGALLLLPLYYQVARGETALVAGLLMAPQGLGAAAGMNRAGRLTDRVGGGRVVVAGLIMLMIGTIAFTQVSATTSYWLLGASLVVRGFGLGFTMMPAMAAAYATLERSEVPRATPTLNVIQRVGGSLGTAVLAVVLQRQIVSELADSGARGGSLNAVRGASDAARAHFAGPIASAFAHTYWWAMAGTAVAVIPALVLARSQRVAARKAAAAGQQKRATPAPTVG